MTDDLIREGLVAGKGIISRCAVIIPCARSTIYAAMERSPELRAFAKECEEARLDQAEGVVWDSMETTDPNLNFKAAVFALTTKGKNRGWTRQRDVTIVNAERENRLTAEELRLLTDEQLDLMIKADEAAQDAKRRANAAPIEGQPEGKVKKGV